MKNKILNFITVLFAVFAAICIVLCIVGSLIPVDVLAQRVGRMGVLIIDPNGRDQFVQSIDFQNTDISVGESADVTIDLSVSSGWTQDTSNDYIYTTDVDYSVGIGVAAPSTKLHIYESVANDEDALGLYLQRVAPEGTVLFKMYADQYENMVIRADSDIYSELQFRNAAGHIQINASAANKNIYFSTHSGEAMRINTDGKVGINDITADGQLDITISGAAVIGLDIDVAAAQSANIVDIDDATGDTIFEIDATGNLEVNGVIRSTDSEWYHCKYVPTSSVDPGASGATFVPPSADTLGGWNLDGDAEYLYMGAHICNDWDATSDVYLRVFYEVDDATATGNAIVEVEAYFKVPAETATKHQSLSFTQDVSGDTQYNLRYNDFTIDYDDATDDLAENAQITMRLNFDASNSDVSDIIFVQAIILYQTDQVGIEIP